MLFATFHLYYKGNFASIQGMNNSYLHMWEDAVVLIMYALVLIMYAMVLIMYAANYVCRGANAWC